MGFMLRLILGIYLLVSICQLLQCTDLKQIEPHSDSVKVKILENNGTNNQTIYEKSEPKTDVTILSNNSDNNVVENNEQIQKTEAENHENNNNNSERVNLARSIDISKYVSKEFHDRNNVFTLPLSTDTEKFINYDHDDHTTTYKLPDYSKDFSFNTQLTTPQSRLFDANYKETVDSVDQTLEHIDNEELTSELQPKENDGVDLEQLYEKTKTNDSNSNLDYKSFKTIIKNDTNDEQSVHKDLLTEEGTQLDFNSSYNRTKITDEKPKDNLENGRVVKNYYETTTRKNTILTKPPSILNNSHISILSNKIETETLKAIDSNLATTETVKTNEPSVQENQVISVRIDAPIKNTKTTTTASIITETENNENVEIVTQFSTTPVEVTEQFSTTPDDELSTTTETDFTTTETSTLTNEAETSTETLTTIDSTTSTIEMSTTGSDMTDSTIGGTDDLITTTEISWRTSKKIMFEDETTTQVTGNDEDKITATETENLERTTTELPITTENTETSDAVNEITQQTEAESSAEITESATTESVTTEKDAVNKMTKQEYSSRKTEPTSSTEITKLATTELPTTEIIDDADNKITKLEDSSTKIEIKSSAETVEITTVPTIAETTEISAVNRLPKLDDTFRKQNNVTTESVEEITTIIELQMNQTIDDSTESSDNTPTSDSGEIIADADGDGDTGKVVAIVISSIGAICLILLAGLLFIMKKRQKRFNYGQRCRPVNLDDYSMDNVSVYNSVRRKGIDRSSKRSYGNPAFEDPVSVNHPLNFPALAKFANNFDDMKAEFDEIPQITAKTNELPEGCDTKNRYANVIPLPETRVFLNLRDCCPNSDYINANYVTGPKNVKGYYIACQAPMQTTVDDFWRMIWEQQCKVILMLTHLYENGVEKCFDYLPPSEVLDCHRLFGDYQVTLKKREVKDKYIISIVQLKNMVSNSWREVTHFWYLGWPDKGVPSEANSLIAFLIEARSYMKTSTIDRELSNGGLSNGKATNEINPVVVHCSPGTGRTGVVIACDIAIREFEQNRLVDIPRIVYRIRRDRASAVQTKEQYIFIYKVISLYATKLTGGALDSL